MDYKNIVKIFCFFHFFQKKSWNRLAVSGFCFNFAALNKIHEVIREGDDDARNHIGHYLCLYFRDPPVVSQHHQRWPPSIEYVLAMKSVFCLATGEAAAFSVLRGKVRMPQGVRNLTKPRKKAALNSWRCLSSSRERCSSSRDWRRIKSLGHLSRPTGGRRCLS